VQYRCAVTTSLAVARGGGARGWPPYLLVTQRYLRGLAAELSNYTGVADPPADVPDAPRTERTGWYEALLSGIRAGVRGIADDELREQLRNHQILVHFLREFDIMGPRLEAMDREDRASTLGVGAVDGAGLGQLAEAAGRDADEGVLRYLFRRRRRQAHLWRTLLDR